MSYSGASDWPIKKNYQTLTSTHVVVCCIEVMSIDRVQALQPAQSPVLEQLRRQGKLKITNYRKNLISKTSGMNFPKLTKSHERISQKLC